MDDNIKVKMLNYVYDYRFGSLWWGAEDFIYKHFENWNKNNRMGHPLLSVKQDSVKSLYETIPMLVGTSSHKYSNLPIEVSIDKITDFGTQIESSLICAKDFLYHKETKAKQTDWDLSPVWERRRIWPNFDKLWITEQEKKLLQDFLDKRKKVALEQGGVEK